MHQLNRKQSYCNLYHSANSISYHTMLIMILNKLTKITFAIARRLCAQYKIGKIGFIPLKEFIFSYFHQKIPV